jgi:hypothetical protein
MLVSTLSGVAMPAGISVVIVIFAGDVNAPASTMDIPTKRHAASAITFDWNFIILPPLRCFLQIWPFSVTIAFFRSAAKVVKPYFWRQDPCRHNTHLVARRESGRHFFDPVDSLSLVPQERMDGDWTLIVEDADVGPIVREGVLNSWGMLITEQVVTADLASPIIIVGLTNGISLRA